MKDEKSDDPTGRLRIGEAAERLGISPETLRRWIDDGRLAAERTPGGQRTVAADAVAGLIADRRRSGRERPIVARSARNRFPGVVVSVRRDALVALVEVQAGPHRLVSLVTREAADELDLQPGSEVVCAVKSTDVIVEVPGRA